MFYNKRSKFYLCIMPALFRLYSPKLLLILLLFAPSALKSQIVELDTTIEMHTPMTLSEQSDLNNFLMLAASLGNITAMRWLIKIGCRN